MSDDERMTDGERRGDDRVTGADAAGGRRSDEPSADRKADVGHATEGDRTAETARTAADGPAADAPAADPWKRDRGARRGPARDSASGPTSGRPRTIRRGLGAWLADSAWEVIGELVFFGLVVLVSWLVYEEVRWPFVAAVYLGVNAVLVVIALAVWLRHRSRRSRPTR